LRLLLSKVDRFTSNKAQNDPRPIFFDLCPSVCVSHAFHLLIIEISFKSSYLLGRLLLTWVNGDFEIKHQRSRLLGMKCIIVIGAYLRSQTIKPKTKMFQCILRISSNSTAEMHIFPDICLSIRLSHVVEQPLNSYSVERFSLTSVQGQVQGHWVGTEVWNQKAKI